MLPGIVAIDVPQETPIEWVEAAVRACSEALGEGRCVPGSETSAATWRASVRLDAPTPPTFRVELRDAADDSLESTRLLEFRELDTESQRWASAGVVVAALVSAREAGSDIPPVEPERASEPEPKPTPEPPPMYTEETIDPPDPLPPASSGASEAAYPDAGRLWLDAAFRGQSGAGGDRPALGGRGAAALHPLDAPWLVGAQLSGSWVSKPFEGRWVSVGIGTGWRLAKEPVWDVSALLRAEQFRAGLTRTRDGVIERDEETRLRFGPGLETNLAVPLAGPIWAFVGAEAAWYSRKFDVRSENRLLGRVAAFSFGMDVGLRWVLWH